MLHGIAGWIHFQSLFAAQSQHTRDATGTSSSLYRTFPLPKLNLTFPSIKKRLRAALHQTRVETSHFSAIIIP
ncbi:hypothetical protein BV898_15035 [Hypsibius exemplaris]|uniref:Uncharacterized protein n=1 Tax=Hypsibius exemplaris TaxID=2072580 RepID=A0A9X6RJW3_HYPEX|nr:hypothetical protein BV898_15035 [Hypsibius exemplaris]